MTTAGAKPRRRWGGLIGLLGGAVVVCAGVFVSVSGCACGGEGDDILPPVMSKVDQKVKVYAVEKKKLPDSLGELYAIGDEPVDPWGNPFRYTKTGDRYDLVSLGADGQVGGTGLDADVRRSGASR